MALGTERIVEENKRIAKENDAWIHPKMTNLEMINAEAEHKEKHRKGFIQNLQNPINTVRSFMKTSKKTELTHTPLPNTRIAGE